MMALLFFLYSILIVLILRKQYLPSLILAFITLTLCAFMFYYHATAVLDVHL